MLLLPREIFVDKVKGDSVVLLYSMYGDNDQLWNIIIMRCVLGSFKFSIAYYSFNFANLQVYYVPATIT